MPMIMIEGVDGTGKTTLANALGKAQGWPVVKIWKNESLVYLNWFFDLGAGTYRDDLFFMDSWLNLGRPDCIIDRGILSGVVYEGEQDKCGRILEFWMNRMKEYKEEVRFVILDAPDEVVKERDPSAEDFQLYRRRFQEYSKVLKDKGFYVQTFDTQELNEEALLMLVWMLGGTR